MHTGIWCRETKRRNHGFRNANVEIVELLRDDFFRNHPMAVKRPDIRARIEAYRRICDECPADESLVATRRALSDRHYLLVSKAAELAGERLLYDVESELSAAYSRFLTDPVKRDPNCIAKGAIVRALVALDYQDADFYLAGIRYRQLEPVWGGTVDTAVDLRISCATGLATTSYPRALIHLVELLHDPEPHARSGAIRAIVCTERLSAEVVLRSKALTGDEEAEVFGDCLSALLQVAPDDALAFVASFLEDADPTRSALAALALGESRLDAALDLLRNRWEEQPFKRDLDRVLLRAAVLHRSEAAFDWLLEVVECGDRASAELIIVELAAYRANQRLSERLERLIRERGDESLRKGYEQIWSSSEN